MLPLVSIVIAVYNGEKYLEAAINSVLNQSYPTVELILVDDGSTDRTSIILARYQSCAKLLYQANQGQATAQNLGIINAKGEYITFLDADDLFCPDKLFSQVHYLLKNPKLDTAVGLMQQFLSPELSTESKAKRACPEALTPGFLPSGTLFRRDCFERFGLFNTTYKTGVYMEWYMRAKEQKLTEHLHQQLVAKRRIHDTNHGIVQRHLQQEYLHIVKAALERRKAVGHPA